MRKRIRIFCVSVLIISVTLISGTASSQSTGMQPNGHSTYYGEMDGTMYEFTLNRCKPCGSTIRDIAGFCRCVESIGRREVLADFKQGS